MSEQEYYKAKKARLIDVTQLRLDTIQLINTNLLLIGKYAGLNGVFAEAILPHCLNITVKYYLFQINKSESDVKFSISKQIAKYIFNENADYCLPKSRGLDETFTMQLTLLLWRIIDDHKLPMVGDRKRLTLVNTDLDYDDLTIGLQTFEPKSVALSGKRHYAAFTIDGIYEGKFISHSQLTARTVARWVVKQAVMIYGPKKYIALAKKTFGVWKLFKKLVEYVSEERINPHIPNDKDMLTKSETIAHLGENLGEYVESKVISRVGDIAFDHVKTIIK